MEILKRGFFKKTIRILAIAILVFGNGLNAHAAPVQLPEHKIKAGLVYNFIKYSFWPESAFPAHESPLHICLFGGDAFNGALDPLQGRTAQMRKINIKKITAMEQFSQCHTVFIHRSEARNLDIIMETARPFPVLLMSDIEGFSQKGGMVELSNPNDRRIHLYLNQVAIDNAGLKVGSQLIKLAEQR